MQVHAQGARPLGRTFAVEHHGADPLESRWALAQRAGRQQQAVAKPARGIDDRDLGLPRQSQVLQAIVSKNQVRPPADQQPRGRDPISADGELAEVGFYELETVRAALRGDESTFKLPPSISIARYLIERWVARASG